MYKQYQKQWRETHPEYNKRYQKEKWREAHPDYDKQHSKQYRKIHKEEILARHRQYRKVHPEKVKEYAKQYRKTYPDNNQEWRKANPNKVKQLNAKNTARRKQFDFISLNKSFENSIAHHIDKIYVIYVPKEMHQSINHSVLRNKNMDEINAIAWNYL
jgi:hypothetical protein